MSVDLALSIALDAAFFAVLGFTLLEYLRHRERVRLVVVLVFASLGVVLAAAPIRAVLPAAGPLLTVLSIPALLAHPVLVLWLAALMRPLPRWVLIGALAAFVALTAGLLGAVATGDLAGGSTAARTPVLTALLVALLGYFVLVDGAATLALALAARERAGASRARLVTAAAATGLFAAALVMVIGGGLVSEPGTGGAGASSLAGRLIALLSAIGYLVAFAPPRALRKLSQQATVYDFIRDLNAMPSGSPVGDVWALLAKTVQRASGASRVEVVERGGTVHEPGPGRRGVVVPFTSVRWPEGRLELDLPEHVLFLEDDMELTHIVVDRAVRAAEREAFIVERERLITELQAASAAKSDFLAAMSHELRTPLNAIIGFSELLKEGGEDAADASTVVSYSEHIHGSGLHLLELVNDVLDLARVEAGRLDLRPADLDLDELVRSTVAAVKPLATEKRQSISLELEPVSIEADPQRIRQVILNLLSNAIKFTPAGGAIRLSLAAAEDGAATLTVSDNGRGIAPADLDRIFEAFQQGSGDRATHHEGTGLGLALTRQLVEAHGGTVSVRSQVGAGSEFTVVLPAKRAPASEAAPPVVAPGKPTVLVIEDDPAAQELLRHRLEGAGYAVLTTASGRQGLAWMREVQPDAVLLDILLPDVDGWEVLQEAKSDPETRSIPIMVVSVVDNRQLGLALGAVDYFVKPVSRERLVEALGRLTFTTKVKTRTVTALVIDADPEAAARYRHLLEPDGFRVIEASTGAEGRRRAVEERPDLILLDALLPDVDAFELASTLRHDPATAAIPVWLSTPAGLQPEAKARLNGNVQEVVARGDDALAAMRAWLEVPRAPSRAGEAGA